jgi:hypothetical protein
MNDVRRLLGFFFAACAVVAALAWFYRPASFQVIGVLLVGWLILGAASAVWELANMPNDANVPRRLRIAGQLLRGMFVTTVVVLVGAMVLGFFTHAG